MLDLLLGVRRSELIALTWEDVDFEKKSIRINKSRARVINREPKQGEGKYKYVLKGTKSKKSRRIVRLSDVAIQVLKNQKFEQEKMQLENKDIYNNYDNLIFTDEFGDYIKGERLLDNFHTLLDKAGVERHNIHDLRHTFCSFLINNKRTVKDVQTLLGHSSAQITLDLYTEQFEESEIEALEGVTDCIPVEIQAKDVQLQ